MRPWNGMPKVVAPPPPHLSAPAAAIMGAAEQGTTGGASVRSRKAGLRLWQTGVADAFVGDTTHADPVYSQTGETLS